MKKRDLVKDALPDHTIFTERFDRLLHELRRVFTDIAIKMAQLDFTTTPSN